MAGSYGDSIGRGEYSGRRAGRLPSILDRHLNHFALLLREIESQSLAIIRNDLNVSRERFPGRSEAAYREIEMQMHYMRRQLNVCMEIIDDRMPLYQMFSSPDVFGYMWSLAHKSRTDDVYDYLLRSLSIELYDIPWSRTGKRYNQGSSSIEDEYSNLNNRYGKYLRNDLRCFVLDAIGSGELQRLGIFNEKSLAMWAKYWPKDKRARADRLDEKMAWLASLSIFVKKFNVQRIKQAAEFRLIDDLNRFKALGYNWAYQSALRVLKK